MFAFRVGVLTVLAVLTACSSGDGNVMSISAHDAHVRYTGRWIFDEPSHPWVGWSGSTVSIRFRGSAISADINFGDEGEHLRIIVDGVPEEPARFISAGKQSIVLASGLNANTEHTVVLMKEAYATSRMTFSGFRVTGSEVLPLPSRPELRIAFFGDSNMEGYSLYNEKNDGTNGTYFAYPATVSRVLGAEMYLQAFGSATLDGPTPNDVVSFVYSSAYDREDPDYRDGFEPQLIVVNAGANDIFRVDPANIKKSVLQHYRNAIHELRTVYGDDPHIILFNAYSWGEGEPAIYSHEIVDEIGGNLSALLFPWCWEQWHGDMVDQAGQTERLADYIVSLDLGFSRQHDSSVVNGYGEGFDVANGSFEGAARDGYGGFGWRYFEDGVERVMDSAGAADGDYFIRLNQAELVHQCVDATGDYLPGGTTDDQAYEVTASIRSAGPSGEAIIGADYEQQGLYKRENSEEQAFVVTNQWQDYTATLTAPDGTWKTYVILKSASGDIEFDNVRMSGIRK